MSPSPSPRPTTLSLGLLSATGFGTAALAVYQWFELLVVRSGGQVACAVNETINCTAVWNSAFASAVHERLGMPVAALGVVWGVAALGLALMNWRKANSPDVEVHTAAVKLWGAAGLLSIVVFAWASYQARAVCLTCLGTYVLVLVNGVAAFVMLPGPRWPESKWLLGALGWVFVIAAPVFLVTLIPGANTPRAGEVARLAGTTEDELVENLSNLPPREAMLTSAARHKWLASPARDVSDFDVRVRHGGPDALIKIVEFSDVLCPHCATFELSLEELRAAAPPGSLSIEPRVFPLVEAACTMPAEKDTVPHIRCLGAKAQICSEDHPLYWDVRKKLFENQQRLSRSSDLVLELTSQVTGRSREALLECINSTETQAKLMKDIEYARRYDLKGTPMVLLNGRMTWPSAGFILGMAVSRGDVNAPWFKKLPEPPPDEDDGHGH